MAQEKYKKWLEPENLILLEGWSRNGLSYEQIAHNCGVSTKTLYQWKRDHVPICNALKKGREVFDYEVEGSLHKSSCGYWVEEEVTEIYEEDGKKKRHIKKMKRYIPPNVAAIIFYLKNRKPEDWKDRREDSISITPDPDAIKDIEEFMNGTECGTEEDITED